MRSSVLFDRVGTAPFEAQTQQGRSEDGLAASGHVLAASLGARRVTLLDEMIVNCNVGVLTVQGYLVSENAGDASRSYAQRRIIWRILFEGTDLQVKPPEHKHPASFAAVAKVRINIR